MFYYRVVIKVRQEHLIAIIARDYDDAVTMWFGKKKIKRTKILLSGALYIMAIFLDRILFWSKKTFYVKRYLLYYYFCVCKKVFCYILRIK